MSDKDKTMNLKIVADDGWRRIPIENKYGEETGVFYFNPTDLGIVKRFNEMAEDFEKKGCQIIGLCLDAEDEETMAEGRAILNNAGVDYLNITPFEGREELLPNTMFPTSYFVDENGIVLDEVVNGALLEKYPKALEKLLAGLAPEASGS